MKKENVCFTDSRIRVFRSGIRMKDKITIGLVQMAMSEDMDKNLQSAVAKISLAAKKGAQIVCLPELFTAPYFPRERECRSDYSEKIPGKTTRALSDAAKENSVVLVGGSIFEKAKTGRYNTSMIFDENGVLAGKYRKIHVPQDENFYEKDYFAPGDLGYCVADTAYCKIGVLICYDQWYPEAARTLALMGAEIIFYPTAIGTVKGIAQAEGPWQEAWENVQRGHAIANGVAIAAANRAGTEAGMSFWGGSFVCNAFGKTLARGGAGEELVVSTIDLEHGRAVREGWRFFHNRRPDTYGKLVEL